jgi:GNAT superfamily N-acetyltransferase
MMDLNDPWTVADEAGIYVSSDKEVAQVAIEDGQIVGAVFEAVDFPSLTYSADVAVLPEYQGRGIGSQLVDASVENFRSYQVDFDITMKIDAVNPMAAEMLERRGAVEVGRTEHHILMRMKHLQHDQSSHTPHKYGKSAGFPKSEEVRYNTPDAERRVGEVLELLPDKARELIVSTSAPVSFWSPPTKGSGSYTYSGGHRIAFSDDSSGLEEFGHALDKELGLRRGQRAEYSRSKEWQAIVKAQPRRVGALYKTGKATENFGWSFKDYVERPEWLVDQYPMHHAKMEELFGGD